VPKLNVARVRGLLPNGEARNNDTSERRGVQLRSRAKQMKEAFGVALPNQSMERTPPRCARLRRSSARWADAGWSVVL
jgi:hypothetical protein